uniref:Uncharacterized protein n=1 Tax=Anas platyrhynchos platyrhynchos TaxID=8840 RepID=A0A493T8F2_ANAPP
MAHSVLYADLRFAKGPRGHSMASGVLGAAPGMDEADSPYENVAPGPAPVRPAGEGTRHSPGELPEGDGDRDGGLAGVLGSPLLPGTVGDAAAARVLQGAAPGGAASPRGCWQPACCCWWPWWPWEPAVSGDGHGGVGGSGQGLGDGASLGWGLWVPHWVPCAVPGWDGFQCLRLLPSAFPVPSQCLPSAFPSQSHYLPPLPTESLPFHHFPSPPSASHLLPVASHLFPLFLIAFPLPPTDSHCLPVEVPLPPIASPSFPPPPINPQLHSHHLPVPPIDFELTSPHLSLPSQCLPSPPGASHRLSITSHCLPRDFPLPPITFHYLPSLPTAFQLISHCLPSPPITSHHLPIVSPLPPFPSTASPPTPGHAPRPISPQTLPRLAGDPRAAGHVPGAGGRARPLLAGGAGVGAEPGAGAPGAGAGAHGAAASVARGQQQPAGAGQAGGRAGTRLHSPGWC